MRDDWLIDRDVTYDEELCDLKTSVRLHPYYGDTGGWLQRPYAREV